MPTRTAEIFWEGDLEHGQGSIQVDAETAQISLRSKHCQKNRTEEGEETLSEVGLAQTYTVAFLKFLEKEGFSPHRVLTIASAQTGLEGSEAPIVSFAVRCEVDVPLVEHREFLDLAHKALAVDELKPYQEKANIQLDAMLVTEVCPESRLRGEFDRVRIR